MRHPIGIVVGCAVLALFAACGDSGDVSTATSTSTAPATDASGATEEYCQAAAQFLDVTSSIDSSSVESTLEGLDESASAAQAAAEVAPAEIRDASVVVATAAREFSDRLSAAQPSNLEEFESAVSMITAELQETYGDLESESAQLDAFATDDCGLEVDG